MRLLDKIIVLSIISLTSNYAYGQLAKEVIIGDWIQRNSKIDSTFIHFDKDRSMYILTEDQLIGKGPFVTNVGDTIALLMRYVIAESENYDEIDVIYAVDNYYNTVNMSLGILQVLNPDLVLMSLNQDRPSVRPSNFTDSKETQLLVRQGSKPKPDGCKNFKNGKFKLVDEATGVTKINRKKDIQIEESERGELVKLKVNWIDDCTYTLELMEYLSGEDWIPGGSNSKLTVHILHTTDSSYIQTTEMNDSNFIKTNEVISLD